jgi:hypothetical protein
MWDSHTGTLAAVENLALPLPGCVAGVDSRAQIRTLLSAHPVLFQLDVSEWDRGPVFDCGLIDDRVHDFHMLRNRMAGHVTHQDVFAWQLRRVNGVVTLLAIFAEYLPVADPIVDDQLGACNLLTAQRAQEIIRATPLPTPLFTPQGLPRGLLLYQAQPNDHYVLDASARWHWEDPLSDGHEVVFGERGVRVTIDPANYTADLVNSGARCPNTDDVVLQYYVIFDVRTEAILSIHTALEFGCVR